MRFRRARPAHRACPRALSRSVPGRARRAELEPRRRWRAGADAAIMSARARGQIVVVVAHRPSALAAVDHLLVMGEGRMQAFGPKGEVLVGSAPPVRSARTEAREAPQLAAGGAALKVVGAEEHGLGSKSQITALDPAPSHVRDRHRGLARRRRRRACRDDRACRRRDRAGRRGRRSTSRRSSTPPAASSASSASATATRSRPATSSCGSTRPSPRQTSPSW